MDYSELITEVQIRTGIGDVASRADYFTQNAERAIEKRLKTGEQEMTAIVTADEDGNAFLPFDLLQVRLAQPAEINGNFLRGKPNQDIEIRYYSKLPTITTGGTNWLLQSEPELYVYAVMREAYLFKAMVDEANAAASMMGQLVDAVNRADALRRYAGRRIDIGALINER